MLVLLLRVLTITFCLLSFLRDITECYVLDVVVSVVSCTEMMSGCVVCANCLSSLCLSLLMLICTMRMFLSDLMFRVATWVMLPVCVRILCVGGAA